MKPIAKYILIAVLALCLVVATIQLVNIHSDARAIIDQIHIGNVLKAIEMQGSVTCTPT